MAVPLERFRREMRFFITFVLLAASLPAASLNDVYFGLDNMRGFAEVYWWFTADGRVLKDHLSAASFDATCAQFNGSCGNYTLNGDKLAIKYKNGQSEN